MSTSGVGYTHEDRRIARRLIHLKKRMQHLSNKAKACPFPCHDSYQKELMRKRNEIIVKFVAIKTRMESPEKYREKLSIYDI